MHPTIKPFVFLGGLVLLLACDGRFADQQINKSNLSTLTDSIKDKFCILPNHDLMANAKNVPAKARPTIMRPR
ncbi:hypothetical protein [Xanthocytophaga agilis]|uniref:Lipoprotein n=1 Tax=Xanthocytophaga agilis TaxID=3048010 RepID=A0AAE3R1M5_9BACT|nr:hypothetical protein [Xanthocytophaga agilis]MDJ1499674.1 hypothetical protein [Xanthocytophaga agilis]